MRLADMHVHSDFSPDGKSPMENFCRKAQEIGVSVICFTDHVDFNTSEINCNRIVDRTKLNFDVDNYLAEIDLMRNRYPSLKILSGIEFSEPHLFPNEFNEYSKKPFDYILCSIHHCYNGVFPGAANISENQAIKEYYDLMYKSIEQCSFQAVAHFDFPRRYFDNWNIEESILENILRLMIRKDVALEINTSSVKSGNIRTLPDENVISKYIELGGRKVVIGSDAHIDSNLANNFLSVIKTLSPSLIVGYFENRSFIELT